MTTFVTPFYDFDIKNNYTIGTSPLDKIRDEFRCDFYDDFEYCNFIGLKSDKPFSPDEKSNSFLLFVAKIFSAHVSSRIFLAIVLKFV